MIQLSSMKTRLMLAIGGISFAATVGIGGSFIAGIVQSNDLQLAAYRQDVENNIQKTLKAETEVAYSVVEEYHKKQQAGELTQEQAKKEAADRVRDLRYDNGKGYFWIDTTEGVNVVLLGRPAEGKSRINDRDADGNYYIQDLITNGKKDGGGFSDYSFPKPDSTEALPKRAYSVLFSPYQWVIGTGVWIDEVDALVAERAQSLNEQLRNEILKSLGIMVVLQLIFLFLARYIGANIARPITRVTESMEVMGTGDFRLTGEAAADIQAMTERPDELGTMAKALQEMNSRVRGLMKDVAETAEYLAASSEELTSTAEQAAEVSQSIANSVVNVASSCSEQFKDVETASAHTQSLTENMQSFRGHLQDTGSKVRQTTDVAEEGNNNVELAVTSMQSIENSVTHISTLIEGLGENSKQIGAIVDTIAEIANQTNLLALNAAIEAARAGEHGRGFAVVADEVRKLAEQSQAAAGEISERISKIQGSTNEAVEAMHSGLGEVMAGTNTVQSTGDSFKGISGMVGEVAESAAKMQSAVGTLTASVQEIDAAVIQINEKSRVVSEEAQTVSAATEEETASMHEIADASRKLAEQAQTLQNAISAFKI